MLVYLILFVCLMKGKGCSGEVIRRKKVLTVMCYALYKDGAVHRWILGKTSPFLSPLARSQHTIYIYI